MKTMKYLFAVIATLIAFTSCEEDGDKIYLQSLNGNELMVSTSDVTLSPDEAQQIVLSFAWTDQTIAVSDENVGTAAKVVTNLEASLSEDFSGAVSTTETVSLSHAFTGAALNTVANAIGATVGQANTVWFRLGSATGTNIPSAYSNAVSVSVTPYEMDMNTGTVLLSNDNNENLGETGVTFHSPNADGIYSGFISIPYGWYHILFQEGNGLLWGTAGGEGAFHITSDAANNRQNMWFPGTDGCYYVIVDTQDEEWSALHISSLTASGLADEEVLMTLDKENNQWIATFTADAAGPRTITVTGQGEQYNATTGDSDGEAAAVAFAMEGESLVLAETAGSIMVEIPQAGECTLRLNLSDPTNCTATVEAGSAEVPVAYPEMVDVQRWDGTSMVSMVQLQRTDAANGTYEGTYEGPYDKDDTEHYGFEFIADGVWYRADANDLTKLVTSSNELPKFTFAEADDNVASIKVEITVHLNTLTWEYEIISQETGEGGDGEETYPASLDVVCYPDGGNETAMTTLTLTDNEKGIYTGTYSGEYRNNINIIDRTNSKWYGCDPTDNSKLSSADDKWNIWFSASGTVTITVNLSEMTYSITETQTNN